MNRSLILPVSLALFFCAVFAQKEESLDNASSRTFLVNCSYCHNSHQCQSRVCYRNKCIPTRTHTGVAFCFRPECTHCTSTTQCGSHLVCYRSSSGTARCIFRTSTSLAKCFPKPSPSNSPIPSPSNSPIPAIPKLPECAPCRKGIQCVTGICKNRKGVKKCVFRGHTSSAKCFGRRECGKCATNDDCESKICQKVGKVSRCVLGTPESTKKCFKKKECAACTQDSECKTKYCVQHKCVKNTVESRSKCGLLKGECESCRSLAECASNKCWRYKCVINDDSIKKCFH